MFSDPGRTEHTRPLRCNGMAPAMSTAKAPTKFQLSRLNGTALGLAVYASPGAVTRIRRKTRFRPLAKRYRTGLTTRRVPLKGFKIASCDSSSFPKLAWRKDIQNVPTPVRHEICALTSAYDIAVLMAGVGRWRPRKRIFRRAI